MLGSVWCRPAGKDLAQIARWNQVTLEEVDLIAKKLAKERGLDLEQCEFNAMVRQVKDIEVIADVGFREWKLQALAKQYKRSRRELMEAYNKALIHQAPIIPLSIEELKKMSVNSTEWTVQGWFPAGVTILFHGFGGTAKTLMLYGVATAIAKGEPWNGYPVKQGEVLILQSDEPTHVTQERLEIMGVTKNDPLHVFPGWQVEAMPQLEAYLKARHEANSPVRFVMVDSNTSINRNTLISENDVEYARPVLQLADLAARYGATICIVHHSNANGDARGTKAIHNSVSEVWALSIADERTGERLLRVQKNRLGRPPGRYKFDFDPNSFQFTYAGEEGDHDGTTATNEKRIELWLNEESHQGITYEAEEIAHFLNIPKDSVRRALSELWSKGIIQRKRKQGGRGGACLYFTGSLKESDQSESSDHFLITFSNSSTEGVSADSDQVISETGKNFFNDNSPVSDSLITLACNPDGEKVLESDQQSDQWGDHFQIIENPEEVITFPEIGDLVIANGTATWFCSGSDKLPARELRPSQKEQTVLPINELPDRLFFELIEPSRVLEISLRRGGKRVKVRNQQTGRTSVFKLSDVKVLHKAGES
jgi:AAA domain